MTNAPMFIKIILIILMCTVCGTALVGVISHNALAFKIAGTSAVLSAILVLVWRISNKSGDA